LYNNENDGITKEYMMGELHDNGNKDHGLMGGCEIGNSNYDGDKKFCRILAEKLAEKLDIEWSERAIFQKLIYTSLYDDLCGNRGLLNQFLHMELDIIAKTLNREFRLNELTQDDIDQINSSRPDQSSEYGKDIEVDYTHATHAKLNTIIKAIQINE
jgi:hypothetical protein